MQENHRLLALGKDKGKGAVGWGWALGVYDNKGRCGGGDEGITKLKTNVIQAAAEGKQCLSLGKACLAACSRKWVQQMLI